MQLHFDFLERFGSTKAAAAAFAVTEIQIRHWRIRGIPAKLWHKAELISKKNGWGYTAAEFAASKEAAAAAKVA